MKNYNEKITKAENLETLKAVINAINADILDNVAVSFDMAKLEKAVKDMNDTFKKDFAKLFAYEVDKDRRSAFENLLTHPTFTRVTIEEKSNGTINLDDTKKSLFKFADLENAYQLYKSTETDKNGKPIANKAATVFGALRFYGLCDCFIRNLFATNLTIDDTHIFDLSMITISDETIFDKDDGKAFASTSNNALEKQLNILARFFVRDVKMLKKDLPILRLSAQKIKTEINTNKSSINEVKTLKFADILFSVVTSRYNNENVKVYTNDKKEVQEKA